MTESRVTLLVVDDHQVVRLGLKALFETVPEFSVVGEASSAAEAVAEARRCQPDVVIMDVRLPDGSGVQASREIRSERPQTRVVMLTSFASEEAVVASIMAGASAYLLKESNSERLIEAVQAVARGGSLLDSAVTEMVLHWMRKAGETAPREPSARLSAQERKVLACIAEGLTNKEIASALRIGEQTVKTYVSRIFQRLHLRRRAEAAAFLARERLRPPPSTSSG